MTRSKRRKIRNEKLKLWKVRTHEMRQAANDWGYTASVDTYAFPFTPMHIFPINTMHFKMRHFRNETWIERTLDTCMRKCLKNSSFYPKVSSFYSQLIIDEFESLKWSKK